MIDDVLRLTGCPDCGTVQRVPSMIGCNVLECVRCQSLIWRTNGRSATTALACAFAALVLLIPANLLPLLTTSIAGVSRQSVLASSAASMFGQGYPELGMLIALLVVVLPIVRCALLTLVLGFVQLSKHRPRWLGRAFRYAHSLQIWAMADVFLLGFVVAYARLHATIAVEVGTGAMCFIAASILTLLTRATLDRAAVWNAIGTPNRLNAGQEPLVCDSCEELLPATMQGLRCPRCAAPVHMRRPNAVGRATALTLAAAILYVPANLYPMATLPIGLTSVKYTVLQGVLDLIDAQLYALALLVFVASFAIPLLKLAALAWCIGSVLRGSTQRLTAKTRLYLVVDEIGRWSMIDPFVIACFVPVTQYNALIHGSAEPAAPIFAAVVVLTILATRCFDPRQLWDSNLLKKRP